VGSDDIVSIATCYNLDGLGIKSQWGQIFYTSPDRPWDPPGLLYSGYRLSFPGDKATRLQYGPPISI